MVRQRGSLSRLRVTHIASQVVFLCHFAFFVTAAPTNETTGNNDVNDKNSTLELVQLLFRHGDRSPVTTYPTDKYQAEFWKYGLGELTDIGAQQAFDLGRFLRGYYLNLNLNNISDHQVVIRSTSITRAYLTAQCVMAGILKPEAVTSFNPRTDQQPITVHKVPQSEDQLLSMPNCPRYGKLHSSWASTSSLWSNYTTKYKDLFDYLSKFTGMVVNASNAVPVSNAVYCETMHNLTQQNWMTSEVQERLINLYRESAMFATPTQAMQRLMAGPLVDRMLYNIHDKIVQKKNTMKLFMFSAHDTNVLSFLSALGVSNSLRPPYTACVMVELHRVENMFYVKILYRNDTSKTPRVMTIPGCEELCPIADLHQLLRNVTLKAQDRSALCGPVWGSTKVRENIIPIVIIVVLLVTVAVVVGVVYTVRHRRKKSTKAVNYSQLLQGSGGNLLDSDDDDELL